ncbi:MAG TPA: NADH-quinone oxidoreductase subunit J [Chloroflexota bacterium]|jgi:NADH-quinone oxidoreductase subunit J|nr:NADH-quinone oxidoreductase subunit J [Chloroflexota bacterium]
MGDLFVPLALGCLLAVGSALAVVLARRPVYAAIALLVHSLSLAGLFALLAAPMVAVGQLIIYSGAIVVLFLFVVTLLPTGGRELAPTGSRRVLAIVAVASLLVAFAAVISVGAPLAATTFDLGVDAVGRALFGPLLVAFELTAPLLLVAMVGAVVIWRRHEPRLRIAPKPKPAAEPRRLVMHR